MTRIGCLAVGLVSLLAASGGVDAQLPSGKLMTYTRIPGFQRDYAYTAYDDRIVIRDKMTGKEETVRVGRLGEPIRPGFQRLIDANPRLVGQLGRTLTEDIGILEGALHVQLFEGGAMIYEKAANYTWWNYHARRRIVAEREPQGDPQAPIITLDYRGGLPPPIPRKNKDPYLVIRADGHATVNDPFERKPRVEGKLSPAALAELMDFIVRENNFFALDSDTIKKNIEARLTKGHVTDLPTTFVWVKSGEREHEVRCYALFVYAEKFPDIHSLAQLHEIEHRLTDVMNELRANATYSPQRSKTQVAVPNLTGMSYTKARQTLQAMNLKIKATPSKPGDVVQRQTPNAGTMVDTGSVVIVYMMSPLVEVPNVLGMTSAGARSMLMNAGFSVKVLGDTKYRVKNQKPAPGSMVAAGTTVTLTLGAVILKSPTDLGGNGPSQDEGVQQELARFQGDWLANFVQGADGKPAAKADVAHTRLTVEGDRFTLAGKAFSISGAFAIDATKTPKTIDVLLNGNQDSKLLGIYEIKGDIRRSCFALPDRERPTRFMEGIADYVIFEWKPKRP